MESFPRVVLEAMAYELPIVTTPVYGIAEQVREGVNAMFYSPGLRCGGVLAARCRTIVADDDVASAARRPVRGRCWTV